MKRIIYGALLVAGTLLGSTSCQQETGNENPQNSAQTQNPQTSQTAEAQKEYPKTPPAGVDTAPTDTEGTNLLPPVANP